jgi:type IV pilus assembly protein PilB
MPRKKLGEMLIEAGLLTEGGLRAALAEQKRWGGSLGHTLVEMRQVQEDQLVAVLSRQLGLESVDLDKLTVPKSVIDLVPGDLAQTYSLVPFAQPMKFLDIAMADPTNLGIVDELRIRTQLNIRHYLAGPKMIERALAKYYKRGFSVVYSRGDIAMPTELEAPRSRYGVGAPAAPAAPAARDAEIDALQERISQLEALVQRDEDVLRKLLALLVDKGIATRDEILVRLG